jgi:hypothetical protein
MKNMKKNVMRSLSIVFAFMALATAIPYIGANDVCILGYKSLCPFMPFSTVIALYISYTIHRYLKNASDSGL